MTERKGRERERERERTERNDREREGKRKDRETKDRSIGSHDHITPALRQLQWLQVKFGVTLNFAY